MTPKEKAKQLVDKYLCVEENYNVDLFCDECGMGYDAAKYCALIAVKEVIDEVRFFTPDIRKRYYEQVKQEIEKL